MRSPRREHGGRSDAGQPEAIVTGWGFGASPPCRWYGRRAMRYGFIPRVLTMTPITGECTMAQRTWLITGVSSGSGRELTEQLLQRDDHVVGSVRDSGKV